MLSSTFSLVARIGVGTNASVGLAGFLFAVRFELGLLPNRRGVFFLALAAGFSVILRCSASARAIRAWDSSSFARFNCFLARAAASFVSFRLRLAIFHSCFADSTEFLAAVRRTCANSSVLGIVGKRFGTFIGMTTLHLHSAIVDTTMGLPGTSEQK